MKLLLDHILKSWNNGEELVMVSVVASSGSTPRGSGARMLITQKGRIYGTIGGGTVEYRSEKLAAQILKEHKSKLVHFALNQEDVANLGMICGGDVTVYFQYISPKQTEIFTLFQKAADMLEQGKECWLITDLTEKDGGALGLYGASGRIDGLTLTPQQFAILRSKKNKKAVFSERTLQAEQIGFVGTVYVFGGGHVAQELVPVLAHVNFRCVVLEDRPSFTDPALFPDAQEIRTVNFQQIFDTVTIKKQDYVLIMTRGHQFDSYVQAQAMTTPATYIGLMGSRSKIAAVSAQMKEKGFTDEDLQRIHTPIGTDILAETPAEIAISIAGEMIRHRASVRKE